MPSLSSKDRVSLCIFSYADGRRCRLPRASKGTPRAGAPPSFSEGGSSHFCHYHARKESRAATAEGLAKDLSAFFSGHTVSANDLTTALARLLPAVVRGDIKPRAARTVAYMAQTLLQSIHLSQSEFKDAFGQDAWRKSIRSGITSNHNRLFPPDSPAAAQSSPRQEVRRGGACPAPASSHSMCHPERSEGSLPASAVPTAAETHRKPTSQSATTPEPADRPLVPTAAETLPTPSTQPAPITPPSTTQTPSPQNDPAPNPAKRQRPPSPHRDPYAIRFDDHNYRLREPEKAF